MKKNNLVGDNKINYIKVISIDAATKSLAIACLNLYNTNDIYKQIKDQLSKINDILDPDTINILKKINKLATSIEIIKLDVVDLLPGKIVSKCGIVERSAALTTYTSKFTKDLLDMEWLDLNTHLLIEYQMGPNRKSGDIQTQLIYHFLQYLPAKNIHVVGPSLKNKLCYKNDPNSIHSSHIAKYTTLYTANKSHTKYLFLSWLNAHGQTHHINKINKKNYADIADAFCQAAAWNINLCK
jgi:hypothetical protein